MSGFRSIAAALALCATISSAWAADGASLPANSPLPAGKPAGVHEAGREGGGFTILLGLAAIAAFTAIMISQSDKNKVTTPTTTGTGP